MLALVTALILIGLYWTLLYRGISLSMFTLITTGVLAAYWALGFYGLPGLTIAAVLFAIPALALNLIPLRRALMSRPLYGVFRRILPEMGATEKEAIEAGQVWRESEMFRGRSGLAAVTGFQSHDTQRGRAGLAWIMKPTSSVP